MATCGAFIGGVRGFLFRVQRMNVVPLGGVFILLGAASSKVHPAQVITVLCPVAGAQAAGSAGEGGSGLQRAWMTHRHRSRVGFHDTDDVMRTGRFQCVCVCAQCSSKCGFLKEPWSICTENEEYQFCHCSIS